MLVDGVLKPFSHLIHYLSSRKKDIPYKQLNQITELFPWLFIKHIAKSISYFT